MQNKIILIFIQLFSKALEKTFVKIFRSTNSIQQYCPQQNKKEKSLNFYVLKGLKNLI